METTFYDDASHLRYGAPRPLKRPNTLDLDSKGGSKKPRGNALLTSPDLHMLKIESPELEKLIIQQHAASLQQQQQCLYQKPEQGYPPAPYPLYQPPPPDTVLEDVTSYNNNNNGYPQPYPGYYGGPASGAAPVCVKEEPQTVPCAIDLHDQERLKLERKRLRNRIAASKCRRRKLERIARLEDKVAHLKGENAELTDHVTRLKEHVCRLKQQVMEHVRSGCEILVANPPHYPPYDPLS